jgi:DNA-binding IclR family transcriptional regulator/nitroimidazol reductase NimA-like FMN-containing flavoprotein (pyridoxamine 5'-phosphate oxidase superfamily)
MDISPTEYTNMTDDSLVPTAERTLRLIELLLEQPDGLSAQELLIQLDMSRSALFLLLRTLKALGYVEQAEKRGRYRLGPRLSAWRSSPAPVLQDLLSAFYQEAARQSWGETLALAVRTGNEILILAQVEGSRQVRSVFTAGQKYSQLSAAADILTGQPAPDVQTNGYQLTRTEDSIELALPVCRDGRRPEAALLLSAPAFRWQIADLLDAYLSLLRVMAARLSYQLGAPAYTPFQTQTNPALQATSALPAQQVDDFLQGPWAARLACVRPDGLPHVIPVWQEWNGEVFHVIAWKGSQWAEYLLKNPSVSLSVDEPWPPFRRVVVRGRAEAIPADGPGVDTAALVQRLTRRYLGQANNGLSQQIHTAFRIRPEYLGGWQGMPSSLSAEAQA